jgi:hypothetical protein
LASGFFYAPGAVVTNLHAIKWASSVVVKPYGSHLQFTARTVGAFDLVHDLCLLEVDDNRPLDLPLAGSSMPKVGETIYVIGNPKGLEGTFSKGMVTAVREGQQLIQIDAPISPGSSGGPVLNEFGEVVGIATSSVAGGQNLNFAVPAALIDIMRVCDFSTEVIAALAIPDLEYEHLKGPVRSYLESSADVNRSSSGEQLAGPYIPHVKKVFDELGRQVETDYFKAGLPNGKTIILAFDSEGLKEKITSVGQDSKRSEYALDPKDRVVLTAGAKSYSYSFWTWDEKNKERDSWRADSHGNEIEYECPARSEKRISTFDSEGREVETNVYRHGNLATTYRFSYESDSLGNWTIKNEYIWMAGFPGEGFVLDTVYKRQFEYFGN